MRRTRFEKFKGKKLIESYVEEPRTVVEQSNLTPEQKQQCFAFLDQALMDLKLRNTKKMRMLTSAIDSALKKFNSERDSKTVAVVQQ